MSQSRFLKTMSAVVVILLGFMMMTGTLMAQSTTTGAVSGTIADSSGAVVPGAKVEVKNTETNDVTAVTSDEQGRYRAVNLAPGKYEVRVASSNFAAYRATCTVEVGRITDVDAKLAASGSSETIEVRDEAPVINTEHQDFANNVDQAQIQNLPINGRRWSNYALLTPNANPDGNFGLISFRGISGLLNNNTIDGGDNNSNFWGEERGRTRLSYSVSQDSVKEFQVNTSNYSAEYGRSAGGAVNTVTKSGTNNLHGSGYWFFRDNALGATNPSTTLAGQPFKPDDRRQQFGATIGGPIIKDRAFFFFNYDQQKRNFPGDAIPFTGTNGYAQFPGTVVAAPGAGCPATGTLPGTFTLGQAIFCRFGGNAALGQTAANAGYAFFTNLLGINPRKGDQLIFFPKVDVKVGGGNWATSYNWLNWTSPAGIQTQPTNTVARDQFGSDLVRTRSLNSVYNRPVGAASAVEAKFHWSTETLSGDFQDALPGQPTVAGALGPHVPGAFIQSWLNIGTQSYLPRPALPQEDQYQYSGSFVSTRGRHTWKIGGEVLHQIENIQSLSTGYGSFGYTGSFSFADFISDAYNAAGNNFTGSGVLRCGPSATPNRPCYANLQQGLGTLGYTFNTNDYAAFIQDDWKALPRLNINFGLRYENQAFPNPQFVNPLAAETSHSVNDNNNFGPRAGFAYDVFGTGKLVVRGGYGLYYGRIINSTVANALVSTGVSTAQPFYTISPSTTSPVYPNLATAGSNTPDITYFGTAAENPMIHEFDGIVEYEVIKNTVVSGSYLKSMGRGLLGFSDTNLPAAYQGTNTFTRPDGSTFTVPSYGLTARPNTSFGKMLRIDNSVNSDYDAFVAQVTRRMTGSWQLQSSYTFSRATDNGQQSATFTPGSTSFLDPKNPNGDFGRSAFDVPHKFIFTAVWKPTYFKDGNNAAHYILDGWTLAPIVSLSSGFTYTGTIGGNLSTTTGCSSTHSGGINCAVPATNRAADVEKNTFRAPSRYTTDYRMSRTFNVTEKAHLEFIAEAFNLFNHPNVSGINSGQFNIGTCSGSTATNNFACTLNNNATFGTPSTVDGGTNLRERQIQFALRFSF